MDYHNLQSMDAPTDAPGDCYKGECLPSACGTTHALSTCVQPTKGEEYYVGQALNYFAQLDPTQEKRDKALLSKGFLRFEWAPWTLFNGYADKLTHMVDAVDGKIGSFFPTSPEHRICTFHETNPFVRCSLIMWSHYDDPRTEKAPVSDALKGKAGCGIYQEFTFDQEGRISFTEVNSVTLPKQTRLSTRVPGLGRTGEAAVHTDVLHDYSGNDPHLDFLTDFFKRGNGPLRVSSRLVAFQAKIQLLLGGLERPFQIGCSVGPDGLPIYK